MRRPITVLLMTVVSCLAVTPAAALAGNAEFVATAGSQSGALAMKGASGTAGKQELSLPPFTIACTSAKTKGSVEDHAAEMLDGVLPEGCSTAAEFNGQQVSLAVKFGGPLELSYTATNGGAELESPVTLQIKAIKCAIELEPGWLPNGGQYEYGEGWEPFVNETDSTTKIRTFPTGFQEKLAIHNDLQQIDAVFSGGCAQLPETYEGSYTGTLSDEVVKGNVHWVPFEWDKTENKQT